MSTVEFKRPLQTTTIVDSLEMDTGVVTSAGGKFYVPVIIDNLEVVSLSVSGVNSTLNQTRLQGSAGAFDNIRVGDIIHSTSAGALTAKSTITLTDCFTVLNKKFLIYDESMDVATLGVRAGDAIEGTGIVDDTVIDRIDYAKRMIYLSDACNGSGVSDLTVTPAIRVTAVRPSTATANANQVDINTTVATAATGATVVFRTGARETAPAILRIEPISNTTGSRISVTVAVSYTGGNAVIATPSGTIEEDLSLRSWLTVGNFGFDADAFLLAARYPRPIAV